MPLREFNCAGDEYRMISMRIQNSFWIHLKRQGRKDFELVKSFAANYLKTCREVLAMPATGDDARQAA